MNPLSQTHGEHGTNLVELFLELGLTELNCDLVEKPDYSCGIFTTKISKVAK